MNKIKWGIIGPGHIARKFATALSDVSEGELTAVLSRKMSTAHEFAQKYGASQSFDSASEFVRRSGVDVVYIATPHNYHLPYALLCLNNGISVVCEKPCGINEQEVKQMTDLATAKGLFFMEAMWTHFFPVMEEVMGLVRSGAIGRVKTVEAKFGFLAANDPDSRLLNKALAGGALLDVGIYCIYLAQMVFDNYPSRIDSTAVIGKTGVDEISNYVLEYEADQRAVLTAAVRADMTNDAYIFGTEGFIKIPNFWQPDSFFLKSGATVDERVFERFGNGYTYEIMAVHNCLQNNVLQCTPVTHERSLQVARIMDSIRAQWGLRYPNEL